jgi:hypothetical protein
MKPDRFQVAQLHHGRTRTWLASQLAEDCEPYLRATKAGLLLRLLWLLAQVGG